MSEGKAREFWIVKKFTRWNCPPTLEAHTVKPPWDRMALGNERIHVIEYSAVTELEAKLADEKQRCLLAEEMQLKFARERNELEGENIEVIKNYMHVCSALQNVPDIIEERDQALAAAEKLAEALSKIYMNADNVDEWEPEAVLAKKALAEYAKFKGGE